MRALPLARDERFDEEAARFDLRFVCEDCGLFDARRGCAHGLPVERHVRAAHATTLTFCKDFEPA